MTLILTVGNRNGIMQSSDYKLVDSNTGAPVALNAGVKQVKGIFKKMQFDLAFTGVAHYAHGTTNVKTIDWVKESIQGLSPDSSLQDVCNAVSKDAATRMKPLGVRGILTLVLVVSELDEPFRIAIISNADWRKNPPIAKSNFSTQIHRIRKPFVLVSGFQAAVSQISHSKLMALARDTAKSRQQKMEELAEINANCAPASGGYISEHCWVIFHYSEGGSRQSDGFNAGNSPGIISWAIAGLDNDILANALKKLKPRAGGQISIVQSGMTFGKTDESGKVSITLPFPVGQGEPTKK